MVNIPHGSEIVPGVANYHGMPAIDLDHFAKPRDARLPEEDAAKKQYGRAMRAMGRISDMTFVGGGLTTEPVVGSVEMTPEEQADFRVKLIPLIEASVVRLRARIAARDAEDESAA